MELGPKPVLLPALLVGALAGRGRKDRSQQGFLMTQDASDLFQGRPTHTIC